MRSASTVPDRVMHARQLIGDARLDVTIANDAVETTLPPVCRFCGERILFDAGWRRCGCKVSQDPANDGSGRDRDVA
jgi:hypothetical protein